MVLSPPSPPPPPPPVFFFLHLVTVSCIDNKPLILSQGWASWKLVFIFCPKCGAGFRLVCQCWGQEHLVCPRES